MHYCFIVEIKNLTDAASNGMHLGRMGFKIVSGQLAPENCPVLPCLQKGCQLNEPDGAKSGLTSGSD